MNKTWHRFRWGILVACDHPGGWMLIGGGWSVSVGYNAVPDCVDFWPCSFATRKEARRAAARLKSYRRTRVVKLQLTTTIL